MEKCSEQVSCEKKEFSTFDKAKIIYFRYCLCKDYYIPLVIMSQKNAIKFSNHMPVIQELQRKMTNARYSGYPIESARAAGELMNYMKKNGAMKNIMMPLIQVCNASTRVYIIRFTCLTQMTELRLDFKNSQI
ncbi:mitochondrial inner membrane protein OXA1L-like [Linepithema humile]|uniref:mitochondrial inner membrane protein OXA1L-like n=1 Tax=Linepithema humile TaxID=83485 RepID=UPI00062333FF|nr:PREDICTED: uncharacterized protein LOC105673739 [Linepithema humile]